MTIKPSKTRRQRSLKTEADDYRRPAEFNDEWFEALFRLTRWVQNTTHDQPALQSVYNDFVTVWDAALEANPKLLCRLVEEADAKEQQQV